MKHLPDSYKPFSGVFPIYYKFKASSLPKKLHYAPLNTTIVTLMLSVTATKIYDSHDDYTCKSTSNSKKGYFCSIDIAEIVITLVGLRLVVIAVSLSSSYESKIDLTKTLCKKNRQLYKKSFRGRLGASKS